MAGKNLWDIESIDEIQIPEMYMENAKMGIARIQFEALKVKQLQAMNEKLDRLLVLLASPKTVAESKAPKITGGTNG